MAKKEINLEQFRAIIKEEAKKLNKKTLLENEKKELMAEMESLGLVKESKEEVIEESKSEKKELTMEEFRAIIKEEAVKLKKRITLENEKKALIKELNECGGGSEYYEDPTMEEGTMEELFGLGGGGAEKKKQKLQQDFITRAKQWRMKLDQPTLDAIMAQAEADNFGGRVSHKDGVMAYMPSTTKEKGMTSKGTSAFGESLEEEALEEFFGMGGGADKKKAKLQQQYQKYSQAWRVPIDDATMADLMAQAEADGYEGAVGFDKNTKTWGYRPTKDVKYQASGFGMSGGPTAE